MENQDFPSKNFLSYSAEKIRQRESFCFSLISATGKLSCFKRLCRFSVANVRLTVPKISGGTFLCLTISAYRKTLCSTMRGQELLSSVFCLTVLNNSAGGILECFINFGYRKSLYN